MKNKKIHEILSQNKKKIEIGQKLEPFEFFGSLRLEHITLWTQKCHLSTQNEKHEFKKNVCWGTDLKKYGSMGT